MSRFLLSFKLLLVIVFFGELTLYAQTKTSQPNVLIIFTDDHRYTGVHALGGMEVKTPHMDRLIEEGISFNNTFLMGAFTGATCIASRAMLHTGRNVFSLDGIGRHIPESHISLGETLKEAGYNTHMVGKWHNDTASLSRSFDDGSTVMGLGKYLVDHYRMPLWDWKKNGQYDENEAYLIEYDEEKKPVKRSLSNEDKRGPTGNEFTGPHTSEIFAQSARNYIENYDKKDPFFLYLAFHAPHDPRQAPKSYQDLYDRDSIDLTPSNAAQHPFDNGHMYLRDEKLAPWPRTKEVLINELHDYYAIISHLDTQIGSVIQVLKEQGTYENTLIVLIGDSGLAVGNHGLMGKQNIYDEDGIHVPFVLSGGWIKDKGRRIDDFAYIHDVFPTLCDLIGVEIPQSVNGRSLAGAINNTVYKPRESTYHAYRQFQRAYRKGNYKLIEYVRAADHSKDRGDFMAGSRVTQLFDISKDPWETEDLSFYPEFHDLISEMRLEMKNQAEFYGDTADGKFNFWRYY